MCLFRKWQEYVFVWLHDLLSPDWLKCAMPEILVLEWIQSAEVRFFVLRHDCKLVPSRGGRHFRKWPYFEPVENRWFHLSFNLWKPKSLYSFLLQYSRVQRNAHSKGLFTTLVWCFESDLFLAGYKVKSSVTARWHLIPWHGHGDYFNFEFHYFLNCGQLGARNCRKDKACARCQWGLAVD